MTATRFLRRLLIAPIAVGCISICSDTTPAQELIGTFRVNYRLNAAGSPTDPNPYFGNIIAPGPYFVDAPPGEYRTLIADFASVGDGNAVLWSGDAGDGIAYSTGNNVGDSLDFTHTHGQIVLYAYDWAPSDNDINRYTDVELYSIPEPHTLCLLVAGSLCFVPTIRRRK